MQCECGCGQDAGCYAVRGAGYSKGDPRRFCTGHSRKNKKSTHCKNGHEKTPENTSPHGSCKICHRVRDANWKINHPVARLAIARKHMNGLADEQYQALLAKQHNKCLICSIVFNAEPKTSTPCIDHDHACCPRIGKRTCGKCIRGVICYGCNVMLGFSKENITTLQNAIQYLKENQCQTQQKLTPFVCSPIMPIDTAWVKPSYQELYFSPRVS